MSARGIFQRVSCCLVVCAAFCRVAPAEGQDARLANVEVEWHAPRECPARGVLLQQLNERLLRQPSARPLRARAHVTRSGAGFRLDLELLSGGARARRQVSDAHCAPLAEAAAVLIALAVQKQAAASEPATEPREELEPPPEPERVPSPTVTAPAATAPIPKSHEESAVPAQPSATTTAPTSASDNPERASPSDNPPRAHSPTGVRLQLSAAARTSLGTFPQVPALGMQAQLAARMAALYLALGVTYWPPFERASTSYPSARLRGSGIFADANLALTLTTRPAVLTAGLELELGQLFAQAEGISGPQSSRSLWFAAGPFASLGITLLKDWWVGLELAALFPAYRSHWLVRTPAADASAFVADVISWHLSLRIGYVLGL